MTSFLMYLRENKASRFFIGGVIVLSFFTGIIFDVLLLHKVSFFYSNTKCLSNLKFVNPEPECDLYEDKLERMNTLQNDLGVKINGYIDTKRATKIAVFTRDLNSQRFAGVNDAEIFYMASLLKVPLAIAYYRLSEITSDILDQKIVYKDVSDTGMEYSFQNIPDSKKLVEGKEYTVQKLLFNTLAYSDNSTAQLLLNGYISEDYLQKILLAIGLQVSKNGMPENLVTAKSYAGVFRILYNASFLQRETSNAILKILSDSGFANGATKKLPKDIVVAHKFGERTILDPVTKQVVSRQLHDCGIVYAKDGKEPYTFCIMTEGEDFKDLETILQDISLEIYQGIVE